MESIRNSISEIWNDPRLDGDAKKEYKNRLYENLSTLEKKYNSSQNMVFIFIIIFLLIINSSITGFSIGPAKIEDLSLLTRIIPIFISYKFYDLILKLAMRRFVHHAINRIELLENPKIYYSNLDFLAKPESNLNTMDYIGKKLKGITEAMTDAYVITNGIFLLLGTLAFYIYAYNFILTKYGFNDYLSWVAIAITLFFYINQIIALFSIEKITK